MEVNILFTFMHSEDAFIQGDFSAFKLYIIFQYVFAGIKPMLMQSSFNRATGPLV